MSVQSHIDHLQERHQALETELEGLRTSPSASDAEMLELKRRKLALKDKIARLEQ